jgi:SAM-dependent methyltransferase
LSTQATAFPPLKPGLAFPTSSLLVTETVLELGPATGNQQPRFTVPSLTHVYGIEPDSAFIDPLRRKIAETGLADLYTPVTCGIEDTDVLATYGIVDSSVDCILSIQVLCSVVQPIEAAQVMYRLLKPGGELVFWEHHASNDWVSWIVQREYSLAICDNVMTHK